ncbi:MAG: hypothetical protein G01um10148_311 [Parcubacteria group bacterium Gr01-1014_8]|nr:MAG: hypothetical protein G01um10148_311 [Parcubacteria group bacterium Gr01-1014_8]
MIVSVYTAISSWNSGRIMWPKMVQMTNLSVGYMLKKTLRSSFPSIYHALWRIKEFMRTGHFTKRWEHYYEANTGKSPWITDAIPELSNIQLPAHVDTILDVGCASGRSFIPFDRKLKLWGIDIVPYGRIKWVRPFSNLTYEQITVEKLTERFEREEIDLSHTFVFECGTLMYIGADYQNRFFNACQKRGCRNFMFLDYPPGTVGYEDEHLKISEDLFKKSDSSMNEKLKVYTLMESSRD